MQQKLAAAFRIRHARSDASLVVKFVLKLALLSRIKEMRALLTHIWLYYIPWKTNCCKIPRFTWQTIRKSISFSPTPIGLCRFVYKLSARQDGRHMASANQGRCGSRFLYIRPWGHHGDAGATFKQGNLTETSGQRCIRMDVNTCEVTHTKNRLHWKSALLFSVYGQNAG